MAKRFLGILLFVLALGLVFTACSPGRQTSGAQSVNVNSSIPPELVGRWYYPEDTLQFEITADGRVIDAAQMYGTYDITIEGNKIISTVYGMENNAEFTLTNGELRITAEYGTVWAGKLPVAMNRAMTRR